MTAIQTPADDAPAAEWGLLAERIPGWRWMPGMRDSECGNVYMGHCWCDGWTAWEADDDMSDCWPDPDDPATAGCLLALLGKNASYMECRVRPSGEVVWRADDVDGVFTGWLPLGRACIAAAASVGRWPGSEK